MKTPNGEITQALIAWRNGDSRAFGAAIALAYEELRRIARRQLRRARPEETLNTTGLVHEVFLKLAGPNQRPWKDRAHFYAICARAMRQILVDFARRRGAAKRGDGCRPVPLEEGDSVVFSQVESLLVIDEALNRLSGTSERLVQVVECRYFAGLTEEETGHALGLSERTVRRDWLLAKAFLRELLGNKA